MTSRSPRTQRRWLPLIIPYALFLFLTWPARCLFRCIISASRDKRTIPNPPLLPVHRAHALSKLSISIPNESGLLALPYELRHQIWSHVLGGKVFHIQLGLSKLPNSRFKPVTPHYLTYHGISERIHGRWENTGLLYVCRQAYQESISLLYQENFFYFHPTRQQCSWGAFDAFAGRIPRTRWKDLRRVKVHLDSSCGTNHHSKPLEHSASQKWLDLDNYTGLKHLILIAGSVSMLVEIFSTEGQSKALESLSATAPCLLRFEIKIRSRLDGSILFLHDLIKKPLDGDSDWSIQVWKGSGYCWGLTFLKKVKGPVADGDGRWKTLGQSKADILGGICPMPGKEIEWVDAKSLLQL